MRILVIDDNIETLNLLTNFLRVNSFEVESSLTGKNIIEKIREKPLDLIILDLGLENINGAELIDSIRSEGEDIPILILTGEDDEKIIEKCIEKGANSYLNKELWFYKLLNKIQETIEGDIKKFDYSFEDILVDIVKRDVYKDRKLVHLENKEYLTLIYFLENRGRLVTKEEIIDKIWGKEKVNKNSLENVVSKIRKKLALRIKAKYRMGYILECK